MGAAWLTLVRAGKFQLFRNDTFLRNCLVWNIILAYVRELRDFRLAYDRE